MGINSQYWGPYIPTTANRSNPAVGLGMGTEPTPMTAFPPIGMGAPPAEMSPYNFQGYDSSGLNRTALHNDPMGTVNQLLYSQQTASMPGGSTQQEQQQQQAEEKPSIWQTIGDTGATITQLGVGLIPVIGPIASVAISAGIETFKAFAIDHKSITDLDTWKGIGVSALQNWALGKVFKWGGNVFNWMKNLGH